ncbi:MAG: tyrosine-type recombinase/integrase [Candidatus Bathyarchaeia archaeon]
MTELSFIQTPNTLKVRGAIEANSYAYDSANFLKFLKVSGWRSEYTSVNALLKHLWRKSRSEASRRAYLRQVYLFCCATGFTPDELIALPKEKIEILVQDYVDYYNDGRHSIRYVNNILHLLKGFFKANGFRRANALELESHYMPSRYRKRPEYIPKKHEIYAMADSACSLRDRAIILTLYSSGLRNATLRAVLYRDVEDELKRGIDNVMIPVYPEMKLIDPNACKNNIPYYTFICEEATQALRLYLREREEKYGKIAPNEPLFASDYNQIPKDQRSSKIMSARQLQKIVKLAAKRARIPQWRYVTPHSLRKAFETVLHSELIDGGRLDPKIQEFFMGHILPGTQDTYFNKMDVEYLRAEYAKLNFGRVVVENKFKVLRMAVARAFDGTGIDPDKVIEEYVQFLKNKSDYS